MCKEWNELISIIVPVYKTEKYLRKCLDSIINQTYKNIEVIVIDDGSPDNSPRICDEYAAKDNRVKVHHQKNTGLGGAWNKGLDLISKNAKYVGFVDSDDYIENDMYEMLYRTAIVNNADIVCCSSLKEDELGRHSFWGGGREVTFCSGKEALEYELFANNNTISCAMWNKLYKVELFSDKRFQTNYVLDIEIMPRLLFSSKKVVCISKFLYYYFQSQVSETRGTRGTDERLIDALNAYSLRYDFCANSVPERMRDLYNKYISQLCGLYLSAKDNNLTVASHKIRQTLIDAIEQKENKMNFKMKMISYLTLYQVSLAIWLQKTKKTIKERLNNCYAVKK